MLINNTYHYYDAPEGQVQGSTVYEPDEVQLSQVLGPDGKPYAIRRIQNKIGFNLSRNKT